MSKSNPVYLWRFGRTGAPIFTLKSLNRAKFPGPGQGVSRVNKTQLARINWQIKSILSGLVTQRLYFLKKYDTKWPFFPPCRNWPIYSWAKSEMTLKFCNFRIWTKTITWELTARQSPVWGFEIRPPWGSGGFVGFVGSVGPVVGWGPDEIIFRE